MAPSDGFGALETTNNEDFLSEKKRRRRKEHEQKLTVCYIGCKMVVSNQA